MTSTPTFFINGHKLPAGVTPANYIDALIDLELKTGEIADRMPPAIHIEELTKDYQIGFWRQRPYRALDRLTLDIEQGKSSASSVPTARGRPRR